MNAVSIARAALGVAAVAFVLPAAAQTEPAIGFTCCNLHYDGDWISDANWSNLPMIPAGTPIRIKSWGFNNRAYAEIGGREYRIGHDYGRAQESLETYVYKLVVRENPKKRIDGYRKEIRVAIAAGRVVPGMTREQVLIAAGFPATHRTPSLDAPVWNYWSSRVSRYEVHWNAKGTVQSIVGQH
jgi:hypothetical protein